MTGKDEQRTIKSIRLLQQRHGTIEEDHDEIGRDISTIKRELAELGDVDNSTPRFCKEETGLP